MIKAVAGYDATFSAPKSVSVLWGLTGDEGFAECHDRAVDAAIEMIEKYGSTTRIRSNGTRLHPETGGLTIGVFRQSTSRADDPQLHTHVVISSKVQTADGRWYALDGRVLKRHQQAFGYFYQSVLRAELTARYGVAFDSDRQRPSRDRRRPDRAARTSSRSEPTTSPSRWTTASPSSSTRNGREPSRPRVLRDGTRSIRRHPSPQDRTRRHRTSSTVDTRSRQPRPRPDLTRRRRRTPRHSSGRSKHRRSRSPTFSKLLAERRSTWNRLDVLRAISDLATPQPGHDATTWAAALDQAVDTVLDACIDLDPAAPNSPRRSSDGRALHIEPDRTTRRPASTSSPRKSGSSPGRSTPKPATPAAVDDGHRPRARRRSTRRRERGRGTRSARARRRPGRCRQDTHAPSRRHRSPRTDPTGDRVRTDGQGGPCPGNRDRHAGRHRRQAPLRTRPPRPEPIVVGLPGRARR